ncbi:MAG: hypothetical protein LC730_05510 [Acidobacteria bacterium]|nr:hypothetical protein [Acidobacteriota bacterium]MCA1608899.1 hypothetical protein [Acidobacteriota bacterium]
MTELQLGKYEFYPYELDKDKTPTLEDLKKLLKKAKADGRASTPKRRERSSKSVEAMEDELEKSYREMPADHEAETEAGEWIEGVASDAGDDRWNLCLEEDTCKALRQMEAARLKLSSSR